MFNLIQVTAGVVLVADRQTGRIGYRTGISVAVISITGRMASVVIFGQLRKLSQLVVAVGGRSAGEAAHALPKQAEPDGSLAIAPRHWQIGGS